MYTKYIYVLSTVSQDKQPKQKKQEDISVVLVANQERTVAHPSECVCGYCVVIVTGGRSKNTIALPVLKLEKLYLPLPHPSPAPPQLYQQVFSGTRRGRSKIHRMLWDVPIPFTLRVRNLPSSRNPRGKTLTHVQEALSVASQKGDAHNQPSIG